MPLQLLYHKDRITVVNPNASAIILTLWTPVKTVLKFLEREGFDLKPETSLLCAISNFYGDGLPQLLRSLALNNTVTTVVILGQNLSQSAEHFTNFIKLGCTPIGDGLLKINGTDRIIDDGVNPELLDDVQVFNLGPKLNIGLGNVLQGMMQPKYPRKTDNILIPLPKMEVTTYPSDVNGHTIVRQKAVEAWKELILRLARFGKQNSVCGKGKLRTELCNVKVVVNDPILKKEDFTDDIGTSYEEVLKYQLTFLDGSEPVDVEYTYGHRIRSSPIDTLLYVIDMLAKDPTRRDCYISLWQNFNDMTIDGDKAHPCLVSLYLRVIDDKLNLTAVFRVHNCMSAWLKNFAALYVVMQTVIINLPDNLGIKVGSITVISNSITIDPAAVDKIRIVEKVLAEGYHNFEVDKKEGFKSDSCGYFSFNVDLDTHELVVEHRHDGLTLKEYRGTTAECIEYALVKDCAISDVPHAIYVGRELARLEQRLKNGKQYTTEPQV